MSESESKVVATKNGLPVFTNVDFSQLINKLEQVSAGYDEKSNYGENGFTVRSCDEAKKWLKSYCENHTDDILMNKLYKDYTNTSYANGFTKINIHLNSFSIAALFKYIRHMFAIISREDRQVVLEHLIDLHYSHTLAFITGEPVEMDYELNQSYTMVRYIVELEYRYSNENQSNKFDALTAVEVPNIAVVDKKMSTN